MAPRAKDTPVAPAYGSSVPSGLMSYSSGAARPQVAPDVDRTVRTDPVLDRPSGDGDHDRFAHYVPKSELTRAYVEGVAVRALCGKQWVPSRDPERYPICPTCKEIKASIGRS